MICTRCSLENETIVPVANEANIVLYNLCPDCAKELGVDYDEAAINWLKSKSVIVPEVIDGTTDLVLEVTGEVL